MAAPPTDTSTPLAPRRPRLGRAVVLACGVVAAALHLVMVTWMFWGQGFSLHEFKAYFANDQESYLAIAVNVANGDFRSVEPFTQTGAIHYPRLYYQGLGLLSYLTHVDPVVWWWVVGLGAQAALAGVVGAFSAALSGRRWLALLGPVALNAGIFGELRGTTWLTVLREHSVIWGSFAEFFAVNGATVAVAIDAMALIVLVGVVSGRITGRRALVAALGCALVLGAMASVHTYTFLTGAYVVTYVVAIFGILGARGRRSAAAAGVSALLLAGLFVVGPRLVAGVGPLALLVAGLLPAAPGVLLAAARERRILAGAALLVLAATPQVVLTAAGVAGGDPFLNYRQGSTGTVDLGVPVGLGLLHGIVLVSALLLVLAGGIAARQHWWTAIAIGSTLAWVLLWTNDVWGASQEPNRFWRNGFTLLLPVVVVVGAWMLAELDRRWLRAAGAGLVLAAVLSLTDYLSFSLSPGVADTIDYHSPQMDAVATVVRGLDRDVGRDVDRVGARRLVLAGPCLAPRSVKIRTGLPVAYENVGMAWSARHDALVALVPDMWEEHSPPEDAGLDVDTARSAGVAYVLVDTSCTGPDYSDPALTPAGTARYRTSRGVMAEIQLWRLP